MTGFELSVACMALNIYFEAATDTIEGKQAVALVTVNRMRERNLDTCDAVFQPSQFSWANNALVNGKLKPEYLPRASKEWAESRMVARKVLGSEVSDFTGGANHYHAFYSKPKWSKRMRYLGRWGSHHFYKNEM
jgi:N-acetylmuramoyl-L-alanine amidase